MGSQIPNSSSPTTKGKLLRNSTCLVYAPGPLVANALEMKCSIRNSPTGTIPVNECRRRQKKECPCPARSGATPPLILTGVAVLGADANRLPCEIRNDERTNHYVGDQERKSRRAATLVVAESNYATSNFAQLRNQRSDLPPPNPRFTFRHNGTKRFCRRSVSPDVAPKHGLARYSSECRSNRRGRTRIRAASSSLEGRRHPRHWLWRRLVHGRVPQTRLSQRLR